MIAAAHQLIGGGHTVVLSCKGQRIESRREVSTHATNSPYKGIVGSTTWKVNLDDLPDDALALRAQEGEQDAATVLYRRCWPIARGISKERGLPEEEWDQLLVDVFLNCVAPGRFDPARGRFGAYFRAAAENEARRLHQRRRSKHRSVESLDAMVAAGRAVELESLRQPQVLDEQGVQLRAAARSLVAEWRDARTGNASAGSGRASPKRCSSTSFQSPRPRPRWGRPPSPSTTA